MAEDRIEDWVREKLENGVARKRIKKVLKNSGHDPSIVDEIDSPFDSDDEEVENSFEPEPEQNQEPEENEATDTDNGKVDLSKHQEDSSFDLSGLKPSFSLPSFSFPEVNIEKPELSFPDFRVPWRLIVVLLIIGIAFYGGSKALNSSQQQVEEPETVEESTEFQGCPDIGVRIISVSASMWDVKVDARVSRGPGSVVVELYRNNNLVAVEQKRFNGVQRFKFSGETADTVVLRPVGCYSVRDVVSLS